ncbi:MAG: hypothetical protein MR598_04525 [Erysipelotrichaceae bacterium]|nr:hypothetical protein [Erysipelotrichaceae bacterium]
MNGNNNIINLINEVASKYHLTPEEVNELTTKYQTDPRDIHTINQELENLGNFYQHQNKLISMINATPNLEPGKNYYVTAFDNNSNIYLQPVSVTVTNPETSEVLVENTFKGYQKHTGVDDIEIAICQIGKLMNFDIVEEYRLYNPNKQKDSVIIRDIVNENEFYDVENLKKRFIKLINNGKLKKEKWLENSENLTVANNKEDYKLVIDYGLNIVKSLPSILEEDYQKIEKKYFDMLLFDSMINQSERDFKDYGILCDKITKRYSFAPLFDNVFPSILKNNDVISVNGITCNRYELIECLFYNYYDKIKERVEDILTNKEKYIQNIDIILKYNVDMNNYNMIMNNFVTNINYFERLNNERILVKNNSNAGYVNAIQMLVGLGIIIAFSICIAYLLYCIK